MGENENPKGAFKSLQFPVVFAAVFFGIGIWRWQATGKSFYLLNFGYIGLSIVLGIYLMTVLPKHKKAIGRRITQFLVGSYMLFFLGLISRENMQLEGFFQYLFIGVFAGATLHYFVAKIFGPLVFGRGWCGYACWTAMLLDFLPYKKPINPRIKGYGVIRYIHFLLSLILSLIIWKYTELKLYDNTKEELYALIVGNLLYYIIGILLAMSLKDNRAFCKYICPIPVLQKITASFSLLKVRIHEEQCINCGVCEKNCPMDIRITEYMGYGSRVHSSECIACATCINTCPRGALDFSFQWDPQVNEKLKYYNPNIKKKEKTSEFI
ncbi:MAG: 4Fe-4S binding protein [Thermotaleaceae bacterium]